MRNSVRDSQSQCEPAPPFVRMRTLSPPGFPKQRATASPPGPAIQSAGRLVQWLARNAESPLPASNNLLRGRIDDQNSAARIRSNVGLPILIGGDTPRHCRRGVGETASESKDLLEFVRRNQLNRVRGGGPRYRLQLNGRPHFAKPCLISAARSPPQKHAGGFGSIPVSHFPRTR